MVFLCHHHYHLLSNSLTFNFGSYFLQPGQRSHPYLSWTCSLCHQTCLPITQPHITTLRYGTPHSIQKLSHLRFFRLPQSLVAAALFRSLSLISNSISELVRRTLGLRMATALETLGVIKLARLNWPESQVRVRSVSFSLSFRLPLPFSCFLIWSPFDFPLLAPGPIYSRVACEGQAPMGD
jgi:hypothetical protein